MKLWQFLLTWLVLFLLAPSIWIHRIFMLTTPPPGSNIPPPPLLISFGGIYFGKELWGQLVRGDIGDALGIFLVLILPILVYTLIIMVIIHYIVKKVRASRLFIKPRRGRHMLRD